MGPPDYLYKEYLDGVVRYATPTQHWETDFKLPTEEPTDIEKVDISPEVEAFLLSDQKKCVIAVTSQFFHVVGDLIGLCLYELERDPEVGFIFDFSKVNNFLPGIEEVHKYFQARLTKLGVKYVSIKSSSTTYYPMKNFYYTSNKYMTLYVIKLLEKFFEQERSEVEPFRKIYLSRGKAPQHSNDIRQNLPSEIPSYVEFTDDERIDNEPKLEKYLLEKGFDIVYPESFYSLEDQIKFISEARILMSVTSAGLINSVFMKPGGLVVEIQSPLISLGGKFGIHQSLHNFYHPISYPLSHNYISIPSQRSVDLAIERLEQLKSVLQ